MNKYHSEEFVLNQFVPNAPFLYPLKTLENRQVHWERPCMILYFSFSVRFD